MASPFLKFGLFGSGIGGVIGMGAGAYYAGVLGATAGAVCGLVLGPPTLLITALAVGLACVVAAAAIAVPCYFRLSIDESSALWLPRDSCMGMDCCFPRM